MKKKLLIFVILIVIAIVLYVNYSKKYTGEPDRTGSWSQINQIVKRDQNWRQFVDNSSFQLGERKVKGSWSTNDEEEKYYEIKYGTYPSLDGSTVAVPMAIEFARQHLGLSDQDANDFVAFNTTHIAYENLILSTPNHLGMIRSTNTFMEENHPVDLILATEPSQDELQLAQENNIQLITRPVCYDAFVFITHKDNPIESLTVEQIQGIYSGEITNWSQVGGNDEKIAAYQREQNSGSQTAMENLVMKGKTMLPPNKIKVIQGMGELVEVVGEYENNKSSIGYTYQYYINTLYKNEDIKVLKINNISSQSDNLKNDSYPFTTNYYGVIRSDDKEGTAGQFLEWILSEEGQRSIEQAGYIPMR